jgi:hypothetical protein
MRTVGTRLPRSKIGDRCAHCDYCGVRYFRSDLTKYAYGRLACAADRRGKDEVTLNRENALGALEYGRSRQTAEVDGNYFVTDGTVAPIHLTSRNDL